MCYLGKKSLSWLPLVLKGVRALSWHLCGFFTFSQHLLVVRLSGGSAFPQDKNYSSQWLLHRDFGLKYCVYMSAVPRVRLWNGNGLSWSWILPGTICIYVNRCSAGMRTLGITAACIHHVHWQVYRGHRGVLPMCSSVGILGQIELLSIQQTELLKVL